MKKLNICYLSQGYGNFANGVETYSTNLINSVAERGHKVTVICPKENHREFYNSKIKLIEVKRKKWDPSHENWFTLSCQFSRELKRLIKNNKFDIIHFTEARGFFWTNLFLNEKIRAVIIGTMHDYTSMGASKNPLFYRRMYNDWIKRYCYYNFVKCTEKLCLGNLNHIISVSGSVKENLEKVYKIDNQKISVIYNGIFLKDKLTEVNNKTEQFILIIGNNLQRKGIVTLFKALVKLEEKYPDLKIVAIGRDINQKYLEDYALKNNIGDRVEFEGRKSNEYVLDKMKKASIYVMPSLSEGFGITFLEAMSRSTPVIGGNVGGTRELIKDEENGFLVNPGDHNDLASKISVLLDDENIRKRFITNGLRTVKKFSVEKMVDETLNIYYKLSK